MLLGLTCGSVVVHNLGSMQSLQTYSPPTPSPVRSLAFSPTHPSFFFTLHDNGRLTLHDVRIPLNKSVAKVVACENGFAAFHPVRAGVIVEGGGKSTVVKVWSFEDVLEEIIGKKSDKGQTFKQGKNSVASGSAGSGSGGNISSVGRNSFENKDSVNSIPSMGSSPHSASVLSAGKISKKTYDQSYKTISSRGYINTGAAGGIIRVLATMTAGSNICSLSWRPLLGNVDYPPEGLSTSEPSLDHREFVILISTQSANTLTGAQGSIMVWNIQRRHLPVAVVEGGGEFRWFIRYVLDKEHRQQGRGSRRWRRFVEDGDGGCVVGWDNRGKVRLEDMGNGVKMTRQVPSTVFSWSCIGDIVSIGQDPPNKAGDELRLMGEGKGGKWERWEVEGGLEVREAKERGVEWFTKRYKRGEGMWEHNKKVAEEAGRADLMKIWSVVGVMLESGWAQGFVEDCLVDLLQEIGDSGDLVSVVWVCDIVGVWSREGVLNRIGLHRVR